jgi:hypothetical protein
MAETWRANIHQGFTAAYRPFEVYSQYLNLVLRRVTAAENAEL